MAWIKVSATIQSKNYTINHEKDKFDEIPKKAFANSYRSDECHSM